MRRLGWSAVLVLALTLGPGPADASEQMRPIGRISSDGAAQAKPDAAWRPAAPSPLAPRIQPEVLAVGEEVLVFGGYLGGPCPPGAGCAYDAPGYARDAAFLHPATGLWRPVAPLPVFLGVESAVVSAGKVYAYGREVRLTDHTDLDVPGQDRRTFLELDPLTGLWTALPPPPSKEAVRLVDAGGRLLAIDRWRTGGRAGAAYDPAKRAWTPLPADPLARPGGQEGEFAAAWAGDRLYLVAWGRDERRDGLSRTIAALDLGTGRWKRLDLDGRDEPVAVADSLVPDEGVYDTVTRRFRALPHRLRMSAADRVPIPDGIVAGGRVTINGHLFDPMTRQAVRLRTPSAPWTQDEGFAATADFLVRFGGSADGEHATNAAHVLRLPARSPGWGRVAPAPMAPTYGAAAVLLGGRFLVLGGRTGFRCPVNASCGPAFPEVFGHEPRDFSRGAALLDPASGLWEPTAPLPVALQPHSAVVSGGIAYALGSSVAGRPHLVAYDPAAGTWSQLPVPVVPRAFRGQDLGGLRLVDAGGTLVAVPEYRYGAGALLRYDPAERRWAVLPRDPLQSRNYQGTAAVWADGRLLLAASAYFDNDLGPVRLASLDLGTGRWMRVRPSRPIVGSVYEPPVVAGGFVVWARGVLDLATGKSWAVPARFLPPRGGRAEPPVAVGRRVVLAGMLYDPAARTMQRLSDLPRHAADDRDPAVAGGPGLLLRHGGARYRPYVPTSGHPTADTYVLRLRGS